MKFDLARISGGSERDGEDSAAAPLRAIHWPVLCAQLSAERDLRRLLAGDAAAAGAVPGSFAPGVAAVLRAAGGSAAAPGEESVNPEGLANGKASPGMTGGAGDSSPDDTNAARGQP